MLFWPQELPACLPCYSPVRWGGPRRCWRFCVPGHKSDPILASEHPGAADSTGKCSKWTCGCEVENGDVVQMKSNGA